MPAAARKAVALATPENEDRVEPALGPEPPHVEAGDTLPARVITAGTRELALRYGENAVEHGVGTAPEPERAVHGFQRALQGGFARERPEVGRVRVVGPDTLRDTLVADRPAIDAELRQVRAAGGGSGSSATPGSAR